MKSRKPPGTYHADFVDLPAGRKILQLRDNLVAAFYFTAEFESFATKVQHALDQFLTLVPEQSIAWVRGGEHASQALPATAKELQRCYRRLEGESIQRNDTTFFEVFGPEPECPTYSFSITGYRAPKRESTQWGTLDETSVLELRFPSDQVAQHPDFTDALLSVARELPFDSGYCGLAMTRAAAYASDRDSAGRKIAKVVSKYRGLTIAEHPDHVLGHQVPWAQWLTFVGASVLKRLGGKAALRKALPKAIKVHSLGTALALASSDIPSAEQPTYAPVASALEPVTCFDVSHLASHYFASDASALKWLRRTL